MGGAQDFEDCECGRGYRHYNGKCDHFDLPEPSKYVEVKREYLADLEALRDEVLRIQSLVLRDRDTTPMLYEWGHVVSKAEKAGKK